ncbi:MAG: NTP transferase domain-containing protein, partial [Anaerolineales bacterium]|nr:NTP transferase domain-containing protein [Anaerolineales bacterium]
MMAEPIAPRPELKVIILAAGSGQRAGVAYPKVLQPLGDAKIIDYVVKNALRFAAPGDIYVVIGRQGDQVQAHLGREYNYVLQPAPRGTGDAVRCTAPFLRDFAGDLLILYGDTPLFRPSPLRGLVNRHYLKG